MFRKNYLILASSVLLAIGMFIYGFFIKKQEQPLPDIVLPKKMIKTGEEDRAYWVKQVVRITWPVIHNLSNETLKKNMPLEVSEDYYMNVHEVSHLEAVGRTMAGLAPWLALPDDSTAEGKLRIKLRTELLKGIANAVNTKSPDYLNFRTGNQPLVDAGYMTLAFIRATHALWDPLGAETKANVIKEFKFLRKCKPPDNNWIFMDALREAFLMKIGEDYDKEIIALALKKEKEWFRGDGWYSDGPSLTLDYYNSHVIHPVVVQLMKATSEHNLSTKADYTEAVERMVRHAEFLEHIISPEGTYPLLGRSITYRTSAFQVLSKVSLMKKLPVYIKPAQVRCALTAVLHNMFDHNRNFDKNGWLVLGFNGHQHLIADGYTSTGSLYMSTLVFLALGLPANDAFWSNPAADWTSKKAWVGKMMKRDYYIN